MNKNDNLKKRVPFVKGDERINREGRPKKLPEIDALMAIVMGEDKDGITAAEAILKALRAKASKGDIRAAEVLLDRAYGKAKQTIAGDAENPIAINQKIDLSVYDDAELRLIADLQRKGGIGEA